MPPRLRRATTTEKGLGWQHQKRVASLKQTHVDGAPCWWCGDPMWKTEQLDADHPIARAVGGKHAERLLHAPCNRARGDGSNDHLRPALRRINGGHNSNIMDWGE